MFANQNLHNLTYKDFYEIFFIYLFILIFIIIINLVLNFFKQKKTTLFFIY